MYKYILSGILAAGLCTAAVSCSEDNYEKGPEIPEGCISAYFASANEANILMTPVEYAKSNTLKLTVNREVSDEAASVPVIVEYKADEIEVPSTVEFNAGEASAELTLTLNNLEVKKSYAYSIRLDDNYADPYSILDGSDVFTGSVMIANWIKVVSNARFRYGNGSYPDTYSDIYYLDGQNKFYIENFLGSGVNLGFMIKSYDSTNGKFIDFSISDKSTWTGTFIPLDHFLDDPDGGSYWWLMKNVADAEYASWTPEGYEVGFEYANFYKDESTTDYAFISMNGSTTAASGYLCLYGYLTDGSNIQYEYIYMYWDKMEDF